ncbi:MAG: peptidase family [Actinomycetia bacterium]|nr:peptidase family [Actinomycetes bacterium]
MNVVTMVVCCLSLLNGPSTVPDASWRWPLQPKPQVLRGFSPPALPWGPGHRGVDLEARAGQPVYAAGAGLISYAARLAGRGVIAITHGSTLRTTYLPVRPSVRPGLRVAAGDRIGVVENLPGHCGLRPCLHWGLLRGSGYLDPLSLLRPVQVRLLPVWGVPPAGHDPHPVTPMPYDSGTVDDRAPQLSSGPARPGRGQASDPALSLAGSSSGIKEASGGLVAGMLLAFTVVLVWRRRPVRRRPPRGVIDLARERRRRRYG